MITFFIWESAAEQTSSEGPRTVVQIISLSFVKLDRWWPAEQGHGIATLSYISGYRTPYIIINEWQYLTKKSPVSCLYFSDHCCCCCCFLTSGVQGTTKSNQIKFRKLRKELVSWKNKARGPKCCYVLSLVFCSCSSSAQNIHTGQQRRADPRLYVNSYSDRNLLAYFEHWLTIYTCINYGHAGLLQFRGIRPPDFAVWP